MSTIWKYQLHQIEKQIIDMPIGSKILSVGSQDGELVVWAYVDPDEGLEKHKILTCGTGHDGWHVYNERFIGTVQMNNGQEWHVFDGGTV